MPGKDILSKQLPKLVIIEGRRKSWESVRRKYDKMKPKRKLCKGGAQYAVQNYRRHDARCGGFV